MEYAKNGDLNNVMNEFIKRRTWFSEDQIVNMMIKICHGVERIHQSNIAHLDLKPGNILAFENNLKIADFGIAKHLSKLSAYTKASKFTRAYAAPEILKNEQFKLEPDIWALGCIFYKLCTGKLPYGNFYTTAHKPDMNSLKSYSLSVQNLISSLLTVERKERPHITEVLGIFPNIYILNRDINKYYE